jgi:predicted ATPase
VLNGCRARVFVCCEQRHFVATDSFLLAGIAGSGKTALLRTIAYRHALAKNSAPGLPSLPKDDKYAAFRTFARIIVLRLRDVQVRVVVVLPVVMCVYVCVYV